MRAIAIDGPSGAGKSTMARRLARELGYIYVDTGALYRAIGLYMLGFGVDVGSKNAVFPLLAGLDIKLGYIDREQRVFANGDDVSDRIRIESVSMAASAVSAIPEVRDFLLDLQRQISKENNVVMDGRDIGTVVLPWADVKIFLTAAPEERAQRRFEELVNRGISADYGAVLEDLKQRDYNDSHREAAPLKPADDAILVDTTEISLEESVEILVNIVKENFGDDTFI